MSYRGPNFSRMSAQAREIIQHAGHMVTWRQYISASGGNPAIGIGETLYYREQSVSAHLVFANNADNQQGVGQIPAGTILATTPIEPGLRDEFKWNGVLYRVESTPQPARFGGQWTTQLVRGDT